MGYDFKRRPVAPGGVSAIAPTVSTALAVNYQLRRKTTGTIIVNRVVTITSSGTVKHTTGTSGPRVFGCVVTSGSTSVVAVFGLVQVEASTAAIAVGDKLRATSGAISTASRLGGTVRKANQLAGSSNRQNIAGIALSSAGAAAGKRLITMFLNPTGIGSTRA